MIYKNLIGSNNYSSDKCMVLPTGKEQIAVTYTARTLSVPELYIVHIYLHSNSPGLLKI